MQRSWKGAWTGGQYSVVRTLAAGTIAVSYLLAAFASARVDPSAPILPLLLVLAMVAMAVAVGFGIAGRFLAAVLAAAVTFGDSGVLGPAARQIAALWLSAHILVPRAPYGSFTARGRTDPGAGWTMPAWYPLVASVLFVGSRTLVAAHALHDGNTMLAGAALFLAALYVPRATGLLGWALSLGLGIVLALEGHGSFSAAWLLHLLTFQPAWIPPLRATELPVVFYDGTCALCHGAVRMLLAEDTTAVLRIAPLAGETFAATVSDFDRMRLPDSVVVARGRALLVKSAAAITILESLGGIWWLLSIVLRAIPRGVSDALYDAVARRRYRVFGRRADACPLLPPDLRARIEA